jgi:protein TonB
MKTRSLAASLLLHATAVLALFTLAPPPPVPGPPARATYIALIAPLSPPPRPVRPKIPPPEPRPAPEMPEPAVPRPAVPRVAVELPPAPTPETPRLPPLPTLDLPRTPAPPAPPLPTDNLKEIRPVPPEPPAKPVVKAAGFGSVETSPKDAANPARTSQGAFDSAAVREPAPSPAHLARTGAFSDASVASPAPAARKPVAASSFTPAEILFKPRPAYTEEARRRQIEGEVLLDVMFGASGEARVVRIVRGLGYGLDENAVAAARAIRFRPALREGAPADSTAVVHIIFQLAY